VNSTKKGRKKDPWEKKSPSVKDYPRGRRGPKESISGKSPEIVLSSEKKEGKVKRKRSFFDRSKKEKCFQLQWMGRSLYSVIRMIRDEFMPTKRTCNKVRKKVKLKGEGLINRGNGQEFGGARGG